MRIGIVTLPRTGGTSFTLWLAKELNYSPILEPHWYTKTKTKKYTDYEIWEQDNTITKWIIDEFEMIEKYPKEVLNQYDFTIIHTRKDVYASAKSLVYARQHAKGIDWHSKYSLDDNWENENIDNIKEIEKHYLKERDKLLSLNADLNTTYEGLYYGDEYTLLSEKLQFIPNHLNLIDNKRRYFVEHKKNKTFI
jgi:hypothetical protein